MEHSPPPFGRLLKRLRAGLDLTQDALAERAGCAVYTIRTYEMGTRRPSREMAEHLAGVLGLDGAARAEFLQLARSPLGLAAPAPLPAPDPTALPGQGAPRAPLPAPLTPLIGRAAELAEVAARLRDPACRLLTILGPGGGGKTRLALEVARALAREERREVLWVELAPLASAAQLPTALADAAGAAAGAADPAAALLTALRPREALLVLDNLEHLLDGADLLAAILCQAPGVRILATSRERLNMLGEWVYELGGLALPPPGPAGARADAAQLFLARAQQADRGFALDPTNLPAVAQICRLLGGSPLGIELAAAWVRLLPPDAIAAEVARSLDFLTHRGPDLPPRHRSLRAVFDHSWGRLAPTERAALARLTVLHGSWDLEAARALASADLDTLATLADAALVRRVSPGAGARFALHELVRQYAAEQLPADEAAATAARHAAHFASRLRRLVAALQSGEQPAALARLSPDLDDVWSAWGWAAGRGDAALLREMARGVVTLCEDLGRLADGERLLGEAVAALVQGGRPDPATLGELQSWHGYFLGRCGSPVAAEARLREALAALPPDAQGARGRTLAHLALLGYQQGRYEEAARWAEAASADLAAAGDPFYGGLAACFRAMVAVARGEAGAEEALAHSAAMWRANGYPRGMALSLGAHSRHALARGDVGAALAMAGDGLRLCAGQRDRWGMAFALLQLGAVALARGEAAEAGYLFAESAEAAGDVGERWVRCHALAGAGRAAIAEGRPAEARSLLGQAQEIADEALLAPAALEVQLGEALLRAAEDPRGAAAQLAHVAGHPATDWLVREAARGALRRGGSGAGEEGARAGGQGEKDAEDAPDALSALDGDHPAV